jgi:hypothetical protein
MNTHAYTEDQLVEQRRALTMRVTSCESGRKPEDIRGELKQGAASATGCFAQGSTGRSGHSGPRETIEVELQLLGAF